MRWQPSDSDLVDQMVPSIEVCALMCQDSRHLGVVKGRQRCRGHDQLTAATGEAYSSHAGWSRTSTPSLWSGRASRRSPWC